MRDLAERIKEMLDRVDQNVNRNQEAALEKILVHLQAAYLLAMAADELPSDDYRDLR